MKALIISDIHGNYHDLKKIFDKEKDFDYLLLLGDIFNTRLSNYHDLVNLLNSYSTKIIAVRGNNDKINFSLYNFSLQDEYVLFPLDHKLFLLTHGHLYTKDSFKNIDYDVYIQGHKHIPLMELKNNKLYLNPGSITYPRGGSTKSYIVYDNGIFYLKELNTFEVIKIIYL